MLDTFNLSAFILSQWSLHSTLLLVFFCDDKYTGFVLIGNQAAKGLNVKNGLKLKQLAKQPPTLKTLMQKVYFFNFKFTKAKFLQESSLHVANCVQ